MEKIATTTLHIELYRIAVGQPGHGMGALERVFAICEVLRNADEDPQLAIQLRELQMLMADWTRPGGWQAHGHKPDVLRDPLVECIDRIVDLSDDDDEEDDELLNLMPPPARGKAPARYAA